METIGVYEYVIVRVPWSKQRKERKKEREEKKELVQKKIYN